MELPFDNIYSDFKITAEFVQLGFVYTALRSEHPGHYTQRDANTARYVPESGVAGYEDPGQTF
jgi:hypothetical protein